MTGFNWRELQRVGQLADEPRLILWIELLTTAHLVGRPSPRPNRTWLTELKSQSAWDLVEAAIRYRIEAAIESRYSGLTPYYQPETLSAHLMDNALQCLNNTAPACDGLEVQWQAGRFRWIDVVTALHDAKDPIIKKLYDTSRIRIPRNGHNEVSICAARPSQGSWKSYDNILITGFLHIQLSLDPMIHQISTWPFIG